PQTSALLVDRDLLAVAASAHNARQLGLQNVRAAPGLGFRDLPPESSFDWILCNVPARIGGAFIGHLLEAGRALLTEGGELRLVVIRDLERTVEAEAAARRMEGLARAARGPRHSVYALASSPRVKLPSLDDESIYARDH